MRALLVGLLLGACAACAPASLSPSPTPAADVVVIQYAINVPAGVIETALNGEFPRGVSVAPVDAQRRWDFTSTYGAPNVYWGVQAPPIGTYNDVAIVVAPLAAASKLTFTKSDWPNVCAATCTWLGHFETASVGR
ncbi:MAG TPA: hypothetical protein VEU08_02370 [Vicinamibacterales bacterium]|nr:hypothetical protein [Vicinamibacterales bacterium]